MGGMESDMMEVLSVLALFGGTFAFIGFGLHCGSKYIDRMMLGPPLDPTKPIVRKGK